MNGPIVVGTDGSDTAGLAVGEATTLATTFHQTLHIVSAYNLQPTTGIGLTEVSAPVTQSGWVEDLLAAAAARAREAGATVVTHLKVGNAAEAILSVAEEVSADVIVVGSRGIDSKSRFILGNVPSRVVHHASCSTYVVNTARARV